jgi:formate-dependent nitrite reductase cytochrome c552 subunit
VQIRPYDPGTRELGVLDFIEAENPLWFHAAQEAVRGLPRSIDEARRGQAAVPRSLP